MNNFIIVEIQSEDLKALFFLTKLSLEVHIADELGGTLIIY